MPLKRLSIVADDSNGIVNNKVLKVAQGMNLKDRDVYEKVLLKLLILYLGVSFE